MIIGHGIDLIEINRVSNIYQKFDNAFVDKYFALDMIDKITPKLLSNNFAIKEAFSKSLGPPGFTGGHKTCHQKGLRAGG
mgnify:CR=1 FL=1